MPGPSQAAKGGATEPAEMSQPGPDQCRITRALLAESLQNNVRRHTRDAAVLRQANERFAQEFEKKFALWKTETSLGGFNDEL